MAHDPDSVHAGPPDPGDGAGPGGRPGQPGPPGLSGRDLLGLGGLLVGAIVVFTVLGLVVDSAAGTSPAFTVIGVGVGIVAAAGGFWLRIRAALRG